MTTGTRDRLIEAMAASIQRRGMNATGLSGILREAGAPKGVLYYHFPDGKTELTVAAITLSVEQMAGSLERAVAREDDLLDSLQRWLARTADRLGSTDFVWGCPLATVALESSAEDRDIRAALDAGFHRLRQVIAEQFVATGRPPAEAEHIAFAIVAAYEGGLLQARVAGDVKPMIDSCTYLLDLIRAAP